MTQFKNKRLFTEVIIWLIITDRFHSRFIGYCLCERASERNKRMRISVPCVTFIDGCNFVTCTLEFLSLCYHCWENFTISQIIYCIRSVKPLTKTKEADFRGAVTIEVVKVRKLVSFRSLRPRGLPIKEI